MASFVSSQNNRLYIVPEATYGVVGEVGAGHRAPLVKLKAREQNERADRRDKTGSRTFGGLPNSIRRNVSYELTTYLSNWTSGQPNPPHGALLAAALGGDVLQTGALTVSQTSDGGKTLTFAGAHNLAVGQGVAVGGELRFVTSLVDTSSVHVNAPFSVVAAGGTPTGPSVSYRPGTTPGSVSLFDYWTPSTAVQRVLRGAAVDKLAVEINGDFHKLTFAGPAAEWIDNASFTAGQGEMSEFPSEPALAATPVMPVPGHLGQVWLGTEPSRFYTVTSGMVELDNDIDLRNREFGVQSRSSLSAGVRTVRVSLGLHADEDDATLGLYEASRQRTPVSVMLQLGQQAGQMFGVYLPSVKLETPDFDDSEQRLGWSFVKCRAQGSLDDEIFCAFA